MSLILKIYMCFLSNIKGRYAMGQNAAIWMKMRVNICVPLKSMMFIGTMNLAEDTIVSQVYSTLLLLKIQNRVITKNLASAFKL